MNLFWIYSVLGCLPRNARVSRGEPLDSAWIEEQPIVEPSEPSEEEPIKLPPNAICYDLPENVELLNQPFSFDGSDSFDPDGEELTYFWDLKRKPPGSAALISNVNEKSTTFRPDLTGQYIAQLEVTNQSGLTDTCKYVFSATPEQGIWVELYWDLLQDDIALHLLTSHASNYDNWFNIFQNEDCNDTNCTEGLEWGDSATKEDNPYIIFNSANPTGPQVIYIEKPQADVYQVVVQDRNSNSESNLNATNQLHINVYLSGELRFRSENIEAPAEGTYEKIVDIDIANNDVREIP